MDKLQHLALLLQAWTEDHGLPDLDAEALLVKESLSKEEKHWVHSFMVLWDATQREEDEI